MIPYQVDPSLHPAQPTAPQLDDGFSPPPATPDRIEAHQPQHPPVLPAKSDF
jgi:hypothetical protein